MDIFDYVFRVKVNDADFEHPEAPFLSFITTEYEVPLFGEFTIFAEKAKFFLLSEEGQRKPKAVTFTKALAIVEDLGDKNFWVTVSGDIGIGQDEIEGDEIGGAVAFESKTDGRKCLAPPWFSITARRVIIDIQPPDNLLDLRPLLKGAKARRRSRTGQARER